MKERINLTDGVELVKQGDPHLVIIAGVHGEEVASIAALNHMLTQVELSNRNNVWIVNPLNFDGFVNGCRAYQKSTSYESTPEQYNLNDEFKLDSKLEFMQKLTKIFKESRFDLAKTLFMDLHEDCESDVDYIWTHFDNAAVANNAVQNFCSLTSTGLLFYPNNSWTNGTSEEFARKIGAMAAFTFETALNQKFYTRVAKHIQYIKLGIQIDNEFNKYYRLN